MGIKDIFIWYQKKIGNYDRQTWEPTVEQKILYGLPHVQMKNNKISTDFIDLDLVRGSSLVKVKPKQGFMTVAKLATLRCVFLPLYSKWWMQQTSVSIFAIMFTLYLSQLVNIAIYYRNAVRQIPDKEETITSMELIVPFIMTWVLSLIHSQIASTVLGSESQKPKLTKPRTTFRRKMSSARKLEHLPIESCTLKTHKIKRNLLNLQNMNKMERLEKLKHNIVKDCTNSHHNNNNINNNNKTTIKSLATSTSSSSSFQKRPSKDTSQGEDDGFETQSLNGNGSRTSEEETNSTSTCKNFPLPKRDWTTMKHNLTSRRTTTSESRISSELESDAETETLKTKPTKRSKFIHHHIPVINVDMIDSTCDTDDECGYNNYSGVKDVNNMSSLANHEWMNATTNSEELSSDLDEVSENNRDDYEHTILNPPCVKASCTTWKRNEIVKMELSTLDISSEIIAKVESTSHSLDYLYVGLIISTLHALIPVVFRLCNFTVESSAFADGQYAIFELAKAIIEKLPNSITILIEAAFGETLWERWILVTACIQRWILASLIFFLLAIAENTFKQRFLYAKLFSHLTSFRRAQQSELPHFRLNKVKNIKTWLSVRSYLKQRGPQRSVDVIVSTAFIITLLLLSFLCVELLKETGALNSQYHVEALIWCIGLGILLLRFMTLGTKINKKYRNLSVLMTEQINLHLQIEQKPHKKEELTLANNVLKLAIDLIKVFHNSDLTGNRMQAFKQMRHNYSGIRSCRVPSRFQASPPTLYSTTQQN